MRLTNPACLRPFVTDKQKNTFLTADGKDVFNMSYLNLSQL